MLRFILFILLVAFCRLANADYAAQFQDQVRLQSFHKGQCVPLSAVSFLMSYEIIKKWDKNHYEMVGETNDVGFHAVLETTVHSFEGKGRPGGINVKYEGFKKMDMDDGFTQKVDMWKECVKK